MIRWRGLSVACLLASFGNSVAAQSVTLNPFVAPLTADDGLTLNRPRALAHRELSASLLLDYTNDPLVIEVKTGNADSEKYSIVKSQLTGQARFAFGLFDQLVVMGGLDFVPAMSGDRVQPPGTASRRELADGAGIGDARVGARWSPFPARSMVSLGLQGQLTFPLAEAASSAQRFTGERTVSFRPEVLFEVKPGPYRFNATLGALVRRDGELLGTTLGDQLLFGLGGAAQLPGKAKLLQLLAELHGATGFKDFFGREVTPLELLFGARATLLDHWRLSVAAGPGLTRGAGAPDVRVLAGLGYQASHVLDRDRDGINGRYDRCPGQAEDKNGYNDSDGCPDQDSDNDQLPDVIDHCPNEPEDLDGVEDKDGCPDADAATSSRPGVY